jgi:hypothetical protein
LIYFLSIIFILTYGNDRCRVALHPWAYATGIVRE